MHKVTELNLECGNPTVTIAIAKMKNALTTYKRQGYKAIILIHAELAKTALINLKNFNSESKKVVF